MSIVSAFLKNDRNVQHLSMPHQWSDGIVGTSTDRRMNDTEILRPLVKLEWSSCDTG